MYSPQLWMRGRLEGKGLRKTTRLVLSPKTAISIATKRKRTSGLTTEGISLHKTEETPKTNRSNSWRSICLLWYHTLRNMQCWVRTITSIRRYVHMQKYTCFCSTPDQKLRLTCHLLFPTATWSIVKHFQCDISVMEWAFSQLTPSPEVWPFRKTESSKLNGGFEDLKVAFATRRSCNKR